MKELQAKDVLHRPLSSNFLTDVCKGISIGLATGLVVALFRWLIDQAMLFARFVYPLLRSQPLWLIPYLIAAVVVWGLLTLVIGLSLIHI